MIQQTKIWLREALPPTAQVPVKYWFGRLRGHCEAESRLLPFLVTRGSHVVDVGGNRGTYTYPLWKLGARVEVFEPNPACFAVLDQWADGRPRVRVHPFGLSSGDGAAVLHVPVDAQGIEHDSSASLQSVAEAGTRDIPVALRALDHFRFTDLDFIKIDTEGHEASVIEGAIETLRASEPALLIEVEQRHNPTQSIEILFERLEWLGYRGFFLRGQRLLPVDEFRIDRDQALGNLGLGGQLYINNFLFLAEVGIRKGRYGALEAKWMSP